MDESCSSLEAGIKIPNSNWSNSGLLEIRNHFGSVQVREYSIRTENRTCNLVPVLCNKFVCFGLGLVSSSCIFNTKCSHTVQITIPSLVTKLLARRDPQKQDLLSHSLL